MHTDSMGFNNRKLIVQSCKNCLRFILSNEHGTILTALTYGETDLQRNQNHCRVLIWLMYIMWFQKIASKGTVYMETSVVPESKCDSLQEYTIGLCYLWLLLFTKTHILMCFLTEGKNQGGSWATRWICKLDLFCFENSSHEILDFRKCWIHRK